tara:strand:+ start:579 stop:1298 length:720 start_codon:yes stop_codon:yes gene_type:complete
MILVFSTARRYKLFQHTLGSLMKHNPDLVDLVNKVYILDDRSTWGDRHAMEFDICNIFGDSKVTTVTFNGEDEFDWVEKLNFLGNLSKNTDYILFIEDDWESTRSMNLKLHLNFLEKNKDIDLITFNGWFHIQGSLVNSYNDCYFSNPFPQGFKHVTSEKNGEIRWSIVQVDNFSLNPSLYRSSIFDKERFGKTSDFEANFGIKSKLKQLFVKIACFVHRGENDTLHDRIKYNPINYNI